LTDGGWKKRRIAPAFVRAVALLAALLVPGLARAQCNSSSNPTPPAAPAQTNFSNQSFGSPPLPAYYLKAQGQNGCAGASNSEDNGPGQDGFPGQPGGSFNSVNTGITVKGGVMPNQFTLPVGAGWDVSGGVGGAGGQGGPDLNGSATTGGGGAGGAAGSVSVQFPAPLAATRRAIFRKSASRRPAMAATAERVPSRTRVAASLTTAAPAARAARAARPR
jgi:hypothetical protein